LSAIFVGCTDKNDETPTNSDQTEKQEITYEKNPDVKDHLRIGVPKVDLPPMVIWDENNNLTGFEIDIIAETVKRLGITYEIIPVDPGTERELLEDDIIDCAWGNMMDTGKQRLFYSMTDPYITIPQVIVIYDGSEINNKDDIQNVSVIMSTPAEILTDEDKIDINFKRVSASRDYAKAFEQLRDGYSDAVICDETIAVYMQNSDAKLKILDEKEADVKYSVAFSQNGEKMTAAVDKILKDILSGGILSELSQKWFGHDY
jgi:ABC-type amino acid transport substrate-binding protein